MSYIKNVAFSSKTPEWYTPSKYVEAARQVLGEIELDAASCELANKWVKADKYFSIEDNSLWQMWQAKTVWLNPPSINQPNLLIRC
jgi:ParB family chromosome partitioning protein